MAAQRDPIPVELARPRSLHPWHDRDARKASKVRVHCRTRYADSRVGKGPSLPSWQAGKPPHVPTVRKSGRKRDLRTAADGGPHCGSIMQKSV